MLRANSDGIHTCLSMVDTELNGVDGFLHQYRSHCASKWVECRLFSCRLTFVSLLVCEHVRILGKNKRKRERGSLRSSSQQ